MKKQLSLLLLLIIAFISCTMFEIEKDTSKSIKKEIRKFSRNAECEENVNVEEYIFQGKYVYLFNPGNCIDDGASEVYDEDANLIGYL